MKKATKIQGNVRGRLADGTPNPIDLHVGKRVYLRRTMMGMSQERLASELGVTFQQVQKYEKGLNRIGASRLWDLSQVLGVNVDFFYEDLDETSCNKSPRRLSPHQLSDDNFECFDIDAWLRKDVVALVKAYTKIKDKNVALNILNLVESMAPKEEQEDQDN
ncbi:MAG: helix-turn-helix transcriptional regulator [Alphaproteobacteria bacterium]|nr:helix-turn-helix transcriptional regulator [Alphaproteobacteria bacterium]